MSDKSRFLVISGPNAGGKSITLKTVGLLQLMFQCGLFLSVDRNSSCCWFEQVLSDIGDNQSKIN
jgi:DNA mismatch repair protein MutS2